MKLSIIIASYNTKDYLVSALKSIDSIVLKELGKRNLEVIVVDNGSIDGSIEAVKKGFPDVELIETGEHVGYAKANNRALSVARGEYVMLFNSDAEFTEDGSITTLLAFLDEHQQVAVLTPKVVLDSGKLDWACHRGFPTPWRAFAYFSGLHKIFPKTKKFLGYHLNWMDLETDHEIDACSGAAMIVRASAMEKVGLLDERFYMYAEDIDWCFRFKHANYKVVYHPGLTVLHHKYQSGKKHGAETEVGRKTIRMFYDTMFQFYEKHYAKHYPRIVTVMVKTGIKFIKVMKGV